MTRNLDRRALLSALGATAVAGCIEAGPMDDDGTETADPTPEPPDDCPVSQGYDVEWPEDLDKEAAESFVEAYELVHYRVAVIEFEPESRLDSYELGVHTRGVQRTDGGYTVKISGGGGVYRPGFLFGAHREEDPADAERVAASEIEDERLRDLLKTAATEGEAEDHVRNGPEIDQYIDLFDSLFESYDPHEGRGDSRTLYFTVDDTPVEVEVQATSFHGDYGWRATYYVDDHAVYRAEEDRSPKDGDLLECRTEV